jgi:predicted lipoprotein with Yx(FWY)xxD motif
MRIRGWAVTGLGLLVPLLAACSPSATAPGAAYGSGSTSASPMTSASPGSAASMGASGTSAGMTKTVTLTVKTTNIGKVLADAKGDTLYWYSKDMRNGPSTCTGGCRSAWPVVAGKPAAAMGVTFAGQLGEVTDAGGTVQATYNGYPLYTYSGDMAPGETAGNGVGGVWHVISGQYLTTMSSGSGSMGSSGSGSSGSGYGSGYGSGSKITGSPASSGAASKSFTSSGSIGSSAGRGSTSGSGSTNGTGSTGNSGSKAGRSPAPVPTSSINGGGCGSGACW